MSCDDFSFLFFFFILIFIFLFLFLLQDSNLLAKNFARQEGVFLVPHFIYLRRYLTLPYLHNLRYVNLSNIRYLFTYQTSSQPPNLLYLPYPSAFRALLPPLSSWFGQSHRSNESRRVPIVPIDHIFQSSLVISRTLKKISIAFPHTWYLW